jgi:hypothetical protein
LLVEELLGIRGGGHRRRGGRRGAIARQHPNDPTRVYRGGKKPEGVKELKEQGREPVKVEWSANRASEITMGSYPRRESSPT